MYVLMPPSRQEEQNHREKDREGRRETKRVREQGEHCVFSPG